MRKNVNIYHCMTCQGEPKFDGFPAIKAHLMEVHGMDTSGMKAKKELIMHLDGIDYYISNYKIILGNGIELHNHTETMRDEDDPMRGA
jgi:hypothetical protein